MKPDETPEQIRFTQLLDELRDVEQQLSNRNQVDAHGRRLGFADWNARRIALVADKNRILKAQRELKPIVMEQRRRVHERLFGVSARECLQVLSEVEAVLGAIEDLDEDEQRVLGRVRSLLDRVEFAPAPQKPPGGTP